MHLEKFKELMNLPNETEWVEFKEAKNNYDFDDIGKYFSALSNEANLKAQSAGWLVFGVSDKYPRRIVGTRYRIQSPGLEKLKQEIAKKTNHNMTFRAIRELKVEGKRVLLFEIPAAARGIPTTWNGIAYGRIHDSLIPLPLQEIEQIRRQASFEDWSSQICQEAIINDLDSQAIAFAREQFKKKNPGLRKEIDRWDDLTFLNKLKICRSGQITRTAIILLGKAEAVSFLSSAAARITWLLKDESGESRDYQHFGPPLILAVDKIFAKIRNYTYRYLPNGSLFPMEVTQYDFVKFCITALLIRIILRADT